MITFPEALAAVLQNAPLMGEEICGIDDGAGRILRQEIRADRSFPPYDRVMMDGYAMRAEDLKPGQRYRLTGIAPAGSPQAVLSPLPGSCLEIMTGAPLPRGADCIVPVEWTEIRDSGEIAIKPGKSPEAGTFIHREGSDAAAGSMLVATGTRLGAREIGVAASCGLASLRVSRLPRIAIIPTGDELVAIGETPAAHQIRQSNGHAIRAALANAGYPATLFSPLADDSTADDVVKILASFDWCLFTGAVSMGSRDFLPRLFDEIGCHRIFHGVAQRPGKPAGFWLGPQAQAIMALPGNPVSALTGIHAFVLPAIAHASLEMAHRPVLVTPATPLKGLAGMTWHLPVTLDDAHRAHAAPSNNSGDFIGLLRSHGFLTLPPDGTHEGPLPYTPWR
ncbi:MAG: molybdopterin molybdotransferase MoeA [Akkermansiaceae bacterium]|jgi:molybdopterin molybdotransferase|nr:molybdopterin molybdotransferase MoeA [Akkermansiaceae bacterium]